MNALLLIDLQNDFLPGGALAVPDGDTVMTVANQLLRKKDELFDLVVATQDFHPRRHGSFASSHAAVVGSLGNLAGLVQVMWPDHCVQGTSGAEFSKELKISAVDHIVQKGTDPLIDSYSGFFDNGHRRSTGLKEFLVSRKIDEVTVLGLATDYCVKYTVLDALEAAFKTTLIVNGCRAVNLQPGDDMRALEEMTAAGAVTMTSDEFIQLRGERRTHEPF
jgi:nicotinamidase/pyrazinamidase